jgi:hypothetical protein
MRLHDRIGEISWAFADGAMKLGGDEARLPHHGDSLVMASLENDLLIRFIE